MERLESPDEVLVMAAILGDLEAFEELVLRYRVAVVRLAHTIVGDAYAEDVAQDSLLLAFKALPTIEEPKKFAAWLSAITRHRGSSAIGRRCVKAGRLCRRLRRCCRFTAAVTTPEPRGRRSSTTPQGSTIMLSPCVSRPLK